VDVILSVDQEQRSNVVATDHRALILRSIDGNFVGSASPLSSSYKYGAFSRLIETRDNRGNTASFDYDAYGRLLSTTDPDSGTTTNTYTGFDEVWTTTDPKGQVRTFEFDTLGRLQQVLDGSTVTSSWTYDAGPNAVGRLSEARAFGPSEQRVSYSYESPTATTNRGLLQRLDYLMDGVEHRIDYTYDDASRLKQTHYPQGFGGDPIVTENSYDASGILTAVERLTGAARDPLWHIDQAFEGHLIQQETFGNDAVSTYAYHPQRRWLQNLSTTLDSSWAKITS
jgi:YD repeat-containing protein